MDKNFVLLKTERQYQLWARRTFEPMPWKPDKMSDLDEWDREWVRDAHKRSRKRIKENAPKSYPVIATCIFSNLHIQETKPIYVTADDATDLLIAAGAIRISKY